MKEIKVEKETTVTLVVSAIALLVIVGGYSSFSGLSVYNPTIDIDSTGKILLNPVTFLAEESIMVYIDEKAVGVIVLKKYLDDYDIKYGSEFKNSGQNNIEIITLKNPLVIDISDMLKETGSGKHKIHAEFSIGDGSAEKIIDN